MNAKRKEETMAVPDWKDTGELPVTIGVDTHLDEHVAFGGLVVTDHEGRLRRIPEMG
jgi:hypothetical protein